MNLEVATPQFKTEPKNRVTVLEEIKKNYGLATLCCLPFLESNFHRLNQIAKKLEISQDEFERYAKLLFESNIWILKKNKVIPNFDPLDLGDITVPEFVSMTVHIISRMTEERPSSFETMTLATNRDLVSEYNKKVNKALNELYEKSQELDQRNCLFSWTHAGIIEFEKQNHLSSHEE